MEEYRWTLQYKDRCTQLTSKQDVHQHSFLETFFKSAYVYFFVKTVTTELEEYKKYIKNDWIVPFVPSFFPKQGELMRNETFLLVFTWGFAYKCFIAKYQFHLSTLYSEWQDKQTSFQSSSCS